MKRMRILHRETAKVLFDADIPENEYAAIFNVATPAMINQIKEAEQLKIQTQNIEIQISGT